ncbi:E3 ubiquitin-protein ligase Mdm2 isoform X2 [Pygocentrus nattereri]|uniref:E3 ubiquitin-protein ligase Mdm2 isoform X2 n=1 Tax=Pygocentrus nattereri TaxID=42514 RepID=UPI00189126A9|nr:E3 ubiquitin-protein ligase Mdm2 isoform X2 [Pygocentrus nattereri]
MISSSSTSSTAGTMHSVQCSEWPASRSKSQESQSTFSEPRSRTEPDRGPEGINSDSSTSVQQQQQQQRRRRRSSDPSSFSVEDESSEPRKRHKSDSFSLTFDDSLSWCVIGGLRRERESSDSSDSCSNSDVGVSHSENSDESEENSDSDNFSVEFEVESIDSDAYSENDDDSVPGEDEVYEVTIFAEDEDSFDEDPEITEEDYWRCSECDKLNPPLPRHCKSCWKVRPDWLPEINSSLEHPSNDTETSAAADGTCLSTNLSSASECKPLPSKPSSPTHDPDEGMDVPDGKCSRSPATSRDELTAANAAATSISDSQGSSLSSSQPSTSSLQVAHSQEETPELERFNSLEASLPTTCLEPCVICQSRPKNGCIVHGRTGHLMACYTCAKKLKNRNKLCPVCREPIQSVVLTYVS